MYFLRILRLYIVDQNALFNELLPPPEVGGELVFDHKKPDPTQGRLHRLLVQPDDILQILFSGYQEIDCWGQIRRKSSRRRPTKCALRRRRAHQIWSFFANFFTRPRTSCRMLKFALAEPVGHVQDPSHWPGILFFSEAATAAVRSWSLLVFFKFQVGLIYSALAYQNFLKLLYILNKWKRLDPKSTFSH